MNKDSTPPNIILITVDSLRADFLGCYGNKDNLSPNIDNLAKNSLFFSNAITPGTPTPFAFPSIMCGIKPFKYGKYLGIPDTNEVNTIAETLKSAGYNTYAVVAENPVLYGDNYDYKRGFDSYIDFKRKNTIKKARAINRFKKRIFNIKDYKFLKNIKTLNKIILCIIFGKGIIVNNKADEINQKTLELINNNNNKPFFIWAHYMDTHIPYYSGLKHFSLYKKNIVNNFIAKIRFYLTYLNLPKDNIINNSKDLKIITAMYESALMFLDKEIEKLFKQIKNIDNTYIIFTADHGEEFMEHGRFLHVPYTLYDEIIKVPLFIYGPTIKNKSIDQVVSTINIAKTISSIANIKNDKYEGFNLTNIENIDLEKHIAINNTTSLLFGCRFGKLLLEQKIFDNKKEIEGFKISKSITTDKYKYIYNEETFKEELYDLKNDQFEKKDISQDNKLIENFRKIWEYRDNAINK